MLKSNRGASPFTLNIGDVYGEWTVLEPPPRVYRISYWHMKAVCRCSCGNVRMVIVQSLVDCRSTRCKACSGRIKATTHGDTNQRLYNIWHNMRRRCDPEYRFDTRYHSKGIRVCKQWDNSYEEFSVWALANGYRDYLSIDRWPDKNGNYEPGNCRWATLIEQARNTNVNRHLTAFGETKLFVEWMEDARCLVNHHTLNTRIQRGWSAEWAMVAPPWSRKR